MDALCVTVRRNRRQPVRPVIVAVGIFHRIGDDAVYLCFDGADIARRVDGVGDDRGGGRRGGRAGVGLSGLGFELIQAVIGILRDGSSLIGTEDLINRRNIAVGVVVIGIAGDDAVVRRLAVDVAVQKAGGTAAASGIVLVAVVPGVHRRDIVLRVQNLRQPIQAVIRIGQLIGRRIRTGALIEAKLHGGQIPVNGIVGILLREISCPYDPALLAQTVGCVIQVLRPLAFPPGGRWHLASHVSPMTDEGVTRRTHTVSISTQSNQPHLIRLASLGTFPSRGRHKAQRRIRSSAGSLSLPEVLLSVRAESKQRHDRGGGRFRISPPSPEPLPSFKRPKGSALLDFPLRAGSPAGKPLAGAGWSCHVGKTHIVGKIRSVPGGPKPSWGVLF